MQSSYVVTGMNNVYDLLLDCIVDNKINHAAVGLSTIYLYEQLFLMLAWAQGNYTLDFRQNPTYTLPSMNQLLTTFSRLDAESIKKLAELRNTLCHVPSSFKYSSRKFMTWACKYNKQVNALLKFCYTYAAGLESGCYLSFNQQKLNSAFARVINQLLTENREKNSPKRELITKMSAF